MKVDMPFKERKKSDFILRYDIPGKSLFICCNNVIKGLMVMYL